jgi:CDP-paratose 2-epimerase
MATVLVTGGAGFVGATLSLRLSAEGHSVTAFDNLKRRGSELNLRRLSDGGVTFMHGDVRSPADLATVPEMDVLVECSAEPSALAGIDGSTAYLLDSNLRGAYNCFDLARRYGARVIFLSTSRVYPYTVLAEAPLVESESRFSFAAQQTVSGLSAAGVSEDLPLEGARTLYGASKLAAEIVLAEYGAAFGVGWTVDRCGVIAGPWQMGKGDQGVFVHWARAHWFGHPLAYLGYGGTGKQVRDLIHVEDLADLLLDQVVRPDLWNGTVQNVGGGVDCSLSLVEATELCREFTGRSVQIRPESVGRPGDVPVYLSDCSRLYSRTTWRPTRDARTIMADIIDWVRDNEAEVRGLPV